MIQSQTFLSFQNTIIPIQLTCWAWINQPNPSTVHEIPYTCTLTSCESFGHASLHTNSLIPSQCIQDDIETWFSLAVKWHKFWGPKIDKKVINSSNKCLISVKIAILAPHIIPQPTPNSESVLSTASHKHTLTSTVHNYRQVKVGQK